MGKVIKHNFRPNKNPSWMERCTPEWCPCLTCEIWLNENLHPECACKPCNVPGLRNPQDVICYKTSNGRFGIREVQMKKGKLRVLKDGSVGFQCPGCGYWHFLPIRPTETRPSWDFNGDYEKPTFSPSILMTTWESVNETEKRDVRCHSFVTDGKIQFLSDCTHELAGQTVELPDLDK